MPQGGAMACCCRRTSRTRQTRANVRVFDDNNFIPSAIEVNYPYQVSLTPGQELTFVQQIYNTGVSFATRSDFLGVDIVTAGVYQIFFSGILTSTSNLTTSLAISLNGEPLPQSQTLQYVATDGPQSVFISTIFKVVSPRANIGVINTGTTTFDVANGKLIIVRIGNF